MYVVPTRLFPQDVFLASTSLWHCLLDKGEGGDCVMGGLFESLSGKLGLALREYLRNFIVACQEAIETILLMSEDY